MTLGELIEKLNDLIEDGVSEDTEVRLATQPHYPMDYAISGVASSKDWAADEEDDDADQDQFVFITEGQQIGYGDGKPFKMER